MKTVITKDTAIKKLEHGLQELATQIAPGDIITLAALEKTDTATIRRYLKGGVAIPTLGRSILANGRAIVIQRQHGHSLCTGMQSRVFFNG